MSFDSKCFDLAEYFYPKASQGFLYELAQAIQDVVEDVAQDPESAHRSASDDF